MDLKYILEAKIPSHVNILIIIREKQGRDVFEKGTKAEQILHELFPRLKIRCSNFKTKKGKDNFYELKIRCSPENVNIVGWIAERVVKEFLNPEEIVTENKEDFRELYRMIQEIET